MFVAPWLMAAAAAGTAPAPLHVEFLTHPGDLQALAAQGAWQRRSLVDCARLGTTQAAQRCRSLALPSMSYQTARTADGLLVERGLTYGATAWPVPGSGGAVLQGRQLRLSYRTCSTTKPGMPVPMYIGRMQAAWRIHGLPPGDYEVVFEPPQNEGPCKSAPGTVGGTAR